MDRVLPYGYHIIRDCKDLIVKPESSVLDALRAMENSSYGIALVIDSTGKLLGVVADSDIRKSITKNKTLNGKTSCIMNKNPYVLRQNFAFEEFLKLSNNGKRRNLPIVNENNNLLGIVTSAKWTEEKAFDNYVVIMVGGKGERLRPLTNQFPKPMLKISEKPLLEIILSQLSKQGFHNFIFALNYKSEHIRDYFKDGENFNVNVTYVHEAKEMGTAGALGLIENKISEPFFVMNGDLLTKVDFRNILEFHIQENNFATVGVTEYDISIPYGVFKLDGQLVKEIVEKPVYKYYVNAGIYLFNPEMLNVVPENRYIDMTDLLGIILEKKHQIITYPIIEYWLDIGGMNDFKQADLDYTKYFE